MKRSHSDLRSTTRFEPLENRQLMSAGGTLDQSFTGDGLTTFPFLAGGAEFSRDVAVQADGKTVVVGEQDLPDPTRPGTFFRKVAVARFNFDGTPDKTFGQFKTGKTTFAIGSRDFSGANAVAIQPDGKIVVAGYAQTGSNFYDFDFAVARLLPNGLLDTSFDGGGKRTIDLGGKFGQAVDVALQSDGKIVVVGENQDGGDFNFGVARLNVNGSLDNSFDGDGMRQVGFGGDDLPEAVTIDSKNRIIIVGSTGTVEFGTTLSIDGAFRMVAVTRLNPNGTRDATFGAAGDGTVVTSFPLRRHSKARAVTVQPSGKIVVAGTTGDVTVANGVDFMLARYHADGRLDKTFGEKGTGLVEVGFGGADQAFEVVQTGDGNLIAAGTTNGGIGVAKLTHEGKLDLSFGAQGRTTLPAGVNAFRRGSVGLATVPGAERFVVTGGRDFTTARYLDAFANSLDLALVDRNASEQGPDTGTLSISRSELLPVPTYVFVSIGGTALPPTSRGARDYDLAGAIFPGSNSRTPSTVPLLDGVVVVIPANQTSATVTLTPRDDSIPEGTETATFTIQPNPAYIIGGNASGTITIFDNDQPVTTSGIAPAPIVRRLSAQRLKRLSLFSEDRIAELSRTP